MALGRLIHYAVDAVLASTVLAGVRRSTGYGYASLPLSSLRWPNQHVGLIRHSYRIQLFAAFLTNTLE